MISEVKIKNFKSHQDTSIRFSAGVNVIEGSPQAGKTNILRAIDLVVNNRPLGAGYIPDFKPNGCTTEILLTLSDGHAVKLEKDIVVNKKSNVPSISATRYTVDGGEPTSNLSDVAIDILNLGEINLQKQMDRPFLAISSGGEIARYINKITKLDQSDEWVKELSRMIRKHDETISVCDENIDKIDSDLKKMSNLDAVEKLLNQALELDSKINVYSEKLARLNGIFAAYSNIVDILNYSGAVIKAMTNFDKAKEINDRIDRLLDERTLLLGYIDVKQILDKFISVQKEMTQIAQKVKLVEEKIEHLGKKQQIINNIFSLNNKLENLKISKDSIKEAYIGLIKKLGKCPTCFSDIGINQIALIERRLR